MDKPVSGSEEANVNNGRRGVSGRADFLRSLGVRVSDEPPSNNLPVAKSFRMGWETPESENLISLRGKNISKQQEKGSRGRNPHKVTREIQWKGFQVRKRRSCQVGTQSSPRTGHFVLSLTTTAPYSGEESLLSILMP